MIQPLQEKLPGTQYCSYRVGGPIDEPYLPRTLEEAMAILSKVKDKKLALSVLGGGSNTLIASRGIRGVTLICKRLMFEEQRDTSVFRVGAGMPLAKVCKLAQNHAMAGAEFMIGIPGTVGGAVAMNAGAMGQETSEVLLQAVLFNLQSGQIETWSCEQLQFAYRKSAIDPQKVIVLAADMQFKPGNPIAIAEKIQKSLAFRQEHHPKEPNGGSVFKNPGDGFYIGKMLDEQGAKGWCEGGAMISPMHANFIVNMGGATSTDVLRLMLRMKRTIKAHYDKDVFPENRFIGEATAEEQELWEALTGHEA